MTIPTASEGMPPSASCAFFCTAAHALKSGVGANVVKGWPYAITAGLDCVSILRN